MLLRKDEWPPAIGHYNLFNLFLADYKISRYMSLYVKTLHMELNTVQQTVHENKLPQLFLTYNMPIKGPTSLLHNHCAITVLLSVLSVFTYSSPPNSLRFVAVVPSATKLSESGFRLDFTVFVLAVLCFLSGVSY